VKLLERIDWVLEAAGLALIGLVLAGLVVLIPAVLILGL